MVYTSITGKHYIKDDPLFQSFLRFAVYLVKLMPRASILFNDAQVPPRGPLQMQTLQKEFQTFQKLLREHVVEPLLKNQPEEATTFVEMYIDKIKEQEKVIRESVFT